MEFVAMIEEMEEMEEREVRLFNQRRDPFEELSDIEFRRIFRLTKDLTREVVRVVTPHVIGPSRTSAIDVLTKVLVALAFFASGSYQKVIGLNIYINLSKSSISKSIKEVTNALNQPEIFNEWVKFPGNLQELEAVQHGFQQKFNFPGVIGCIDCTHVAIFPPSGNPLHPEYIYVNRKQYHSLNVQLICDSDLRIINVNARYPGSSHDSHIWNNSNVQIALQALHNAGQTNFYLLGDSGYPLRPYCLTPIMDEIEEDTPEARYNRAHTSTRNIIERCNGLLKMRFRCLLKHRVLHYSPETCGKITNACVILHNMCIDANVPIEEEDDNIQDDPEPPQPRNPNHHLPGYNDGLRARADVIRLHFQ